MKDRLAKIESAFLKALAQAHDLGAVAEIRVTYLGKKGQLTELLRSVGELPIKERPIFGNSVNRLRAKLDEKLSKYEDELEAIAQRKAILDQSLDVTLPGREPKTGFLHPLSIIEHKLLNIFRSLGFSVVDGPEIETDFYNFEALNFPPDHPARDMQDTLFVEGERLLRTHTSPMQVRVMEQHKPPIKIVVPGRVYRHDSDTTHSPVFHQIEGLCVGDDVTFAQLKGTLEAFLIQTFGETTKTRFRPSFFPFTEPSAEVDVEGGSGWMEILGCGMVDPKVLDFVGQAWKNRGQESPYDSERVTGFAFGLGIERIAMILYGIRDIRLFYENDVRFLSQFRIHA